MKIAYLTSQGTCLVQQQTKNSINKINEAAAALQCNQIFLFIQCSTNRIEQFIVTNISG